MSPLASNLFSTLSAAVGVSIAVSQLAAVARSKRRLEFERTQLTAAKLDSALESADINALGSYLFETVGSVHLGDVARDLALQDRVLTALGLISEYTRSTASEPDAEPISEPDAMRSSMPVAPIYELEQARKSVTSGEVWNGLARARRFLERGLRSRLSIDSQKTIGASRLLSIAVERGVVEGGDANSLRYAINVANRGIHGEDIEPGIALEAIDLVERVLSPSAGAQPH